MRAGQWRFLVRRNLLVDGPDVPAVRYNATPKLNIELRDNRVVQTPPFEASSVHEQAKGAGPRPPHGQP